MVFVGIAEAKASLSLLLLRVAGGEQITITRHGVAVALLTAPVPDQRRRPEDVAADIKALRQAAQIENIAIQELIDDE